MVDIFGSLNIMGLLDSILTILIIVFGIIIAAGIVFYIMFITQFKIKVRVKELINGRKIIHDDKARVITIDGVEFWQLFKGKDKFQVPPAEAIEVDNKGRKCVEAYKLDTGEFVFGKDTCKVEEVPEKLTKIKDKVKREESIAAWKKKNNIVDSIQPLTTKQRIILVNQIKKAQMKKTKKWQDYLMPIVGIASIVIIVLALMIFYGDMAAPLLKMADKQAAWEKEQTYQLEILQSIKNDIQTLKDESGGNIGSPPD